MQCDYFLVAHNSNAYTYIRMKIIQQRNFIDGYFLVAHNNNAYPYIQMKIIQQRNFIYGYFLAADDNNNNVYNLYSDEHNRTP